MTGPGRGGERPTRHQSPRKMAIPPVRHQSEEDNKTPACGVHDRIHEGVHVAGCRLRGLGRRWAPVGAATDNMPGQGVHDAIMNPLHDGSDAADDEAMTLSLRSGRMNRTEVQAPDSLPCSLHANKPIESPAGVLVLAYLVVEAIGVLTATGGFHKRHCAAPS